MFLKLPNFLQKLLLLSVLGCHLHVDQLLYSQPEVVLRHLQLFLDEAIRVVVVPEWLPKQEGLTRVVLYDSELSLIVDSGPAGCRPIKLDRDQSLEH